MEKGADFNWLRKIAKDEKSKKWIEKIEKWHKDAFEKGKFIKSSRPFSVNLGKYKIWFRRCSAYSSADIYTEIFKENDHLSIPEFSGKDADLVVDIGANEGYYTLKIKQNNPMCKVMAIEPNPLAFEILKKNIESNKIQGVILVNKAICNRNGKMTLEIVESVSAIGGRDVRVIDRPWLKKEMIRKIKVDCITLERLFRIYNIDRVDILKLDIEGMEFDILKNSKNILDKVRKIVVEWHSEKIRDNVKRFLKKNGFNLLYEEKRDYGNLYFINQQQYNDFMIRKYYEKSVKDEWKRLIKDPYHRLEFDTTMLFLKKYLPRKGLILDAGGGPGRYTIELAKRGYDIVLLDLAKENLKFAKKQIKRAKVEKKVKAIIQGDVRNLSRFENNSFDAVLCLGGPLSHIKGEKQRDKAISELIRVAKPMAPIFISVFGKFGRLNLISSNSDQEIGSKYFERFIRTGESYSWKGKYYAHYFSPEEIKEHFKRKNFKIIQLIGLEGLATPYRKAINNLAKNKRAWHNWLYMHYKLCTHPIIVGISIHILLIGRKE